MRGIGMGLAGRSPGVGLPRSDGEARRYQDKIKDTQSANLIGYWPLNGNALDASGHGFNGTPSANVTWGDGVVAGSQAAVFAGNAYINCISAGLAAAFNGAAGTLAAWGIVSAVGDWTDAAWRSIVVISADVNNYADISKRSTANSFAFSYGAGGTPESRYQTMSDITWCHFALTWDKAAEQAIYYLNGTALETDVALGIWAGAITKFLIGANAATPTQPWKGSIAHVAIWDIALTGTQVANLAVTTPPF